MTKFAILLAAFVVLSFQQAAFAQPRLSGAGDSASQNSYDASTNWNLNR